MVLTGGYAGSYASYAGEIMDMHRMGLTGTQIEARLWNKPDPESPEHALHETIPSRQMIVYIIRRCTGELDRRAERVRALNLRIAEIRARGAVRSPTNGRVIDMGGPRDVWLHFSAGPEAWR